MFNEISSFVNYESTNLFILMLLYIALIKFYLLQVVSLYQIRSSAETKEMMEEN